MNKNCPTTAWQVLVAGVFVVAAPGCAEPRCPSGYIKRGDTCYRVKDAGSDAREIEPENGPADAGLDANPERDTDGDSGEVDGDAAEPEDTNDECFGVPCEHGGRCSIVEGGFSCDCAGTGYEGPTCAIDRDECAMLNTCTSSAYPCVQAAPPGFTCRGQFADWPMPDALAGAKHAPAYDTSTKGVVRDTVTGLTWQGEPGTRSSGYTWLEAQSYCEQLTLAEYGDWRLPSKIELESIVDETARPASSPFIFGDPGNVLWTASPVVGEPDHAWLLDFLNGSSAYYVEVSSPLGVRCVRGPAASTWSKLPASRYTLDKGGNAITDNRTGLIWERTLSTGNHTWEAAKQYCASLGVGWRVPAYKELLTLVDPTRSNPSIDPLFPNTPAVSFWTASPSLRTDGTPDWPRRIDFLKGESDFYTSTAPNRVRCVK